MTEYIEKINLIYKEIKEIKSEQCVLDYDSKTEVIRIKMNAIASLNSIISMETSLATS